MKAVEGIRGGGGGMGGRGGLRVLYMSLCLFPLKFDFFLLHAGLSSYPASFLSYTFLQPSFKDQNLTNAHS